MADNFEPVANVKLRVEEFHNRLKSQVAKLTCDAKSYEEMHDYLKTLDNDQVRQLVMVLNGQLHQVVAAVKSAA